jgi:hypothetical protein
MTFILINGALSEELSGGCYSVKTKPRKDTKDKRQELARPLGHPDYGAQVGPATKIQTEKAGHGSIAPPKTLLLDSSIDNIAPDG